MLNLFRDYFNDNLWGVLPFPRFFIHMFSLDPYSSSIGAAPLLPFFFPPEEKKKRFKYMLPGLCQSLRNILCICIFKYVFFHITLTAAL